MTSTLALAVLPLLILALSASAFAPHSLPAGKRRSTSASVETHSAPERTELASVDLADMSSSAPPILPPIPPTSKRLFLVRHGEVINPGGDRPVYYGAMDVPLSPHGEEEARAAATYLGGFELQNVASSPLSRAVFGANEVRSMQKDLTVSSQELVLYEGFAEMDRGSWCGMTLDEIGRDAMKRFDACDPSATPEGAESYPELKERVLRARDKLLDITEAGKSSAIVSHLQVTRSMLSDALGVPTEQMSKMKVATASVTCIDYCTITGEQTVHFQSFKPDVGLRKSKDMAN